MFLLEYLLYLLALAVDSLFCFTTNVFLLVLIIVLNILTGMVERVVEHVLKRIILSSIQQRMDAHAKTAINNIKDSARKIKLQFQTITIHLESVPIGILSLNLQPRNNLFLVHSDPKEKPNMFLRIVRSLIHTGLAIDVLVKLGIHPLMAFVLLFPETISMFFILQNSSSNYQDYILK